MTWPQILSKILKPKMMNVKDVWLSWHAAMQCSQSGVKLYKNKSRTWPQIFWVENIMESRLFFLSPCTCISFLPAARVITKGIFLSRWRIVLMHVTARRIESNCTFYANLEQEQRARQLTCSAAAASRKQLCTSDAKSWFKWVSFLNKNSPRKEHERSPQVECSLNITR